MCCRLMGGMWRIEGGAGELVIVRWNVVDVRCGPGEEKAIRVWHEGALLGCQVWAVMQLRVWMVTVRLNICIADLLPSRQLL